MNKTRCRLKIISLFLLFLMLFSSLNVYATSVPYTNQDTLSNNGITIKEISDDEALIFENGTVNKILRTYTTNGVCVEVKNLITDELITMTTDTKSNTFTISDSVSKKVFPLELSYEEQTRSSVPPKYKHVKISYSQLNKYVTASVGSLSSIAGIIVTILSAKAIIGITVAGIISIALSGVSLAATLQSIRKASPNHGIIVHLKRVTKYKYQGSFKIKYYVYTSYKKISYY